MDKPNEAIVEALAHPFKRDKLLDVARRGSKVAILTSDIMLPGDYRRLILTTVLVQLKVAGVHEKDITTLDAVGSHQMNTEE